ncbi:MAG TPA: CoA pyrophosphatase [Dissulfurispiraceae bacterium]|nr:CoA pyrophosphatase [Dissulfurispiraceae bacterium]
MHSLGQLFGRFPAHPSLLGKSGYINTAVLVLLARFDGEYHFVFQQRAAQVRQAGEICFPGGAYQPEDGSLERTALRETFEEMGIPDERLVVLGQLDTLLAPIGATVDAFVSAADIAGLAEIVPNRNEVDAVFSVPVAYFEQNAPEEYHAVLKVHPTEVDSQTGREKILFPAAALGLPAQYATPWGNLRHIIYVYRTDYGLIWGITAKFIVDIVGRLK